MSHPFWKTNGGPEKAIGQRPEEWSQGAVGLGVEGLEAEDMLSPEEYPTVEPQSSQVDLDDNVLQHHALNPIQEDVSCDTPPSDEVTRKASSSSTPQHAKAKAEPESEILKDKKQGTSTPGMVAASFASLYSFGGSFFSRRASNSSQKSDEDPLDTRDVKAIFNGKPFRRSSNDVLRTQSLGTPPEQSPELAPHHQLEDPSGFGRASSGGRLAAKSLDLPANVRTLGLPQKDWGSLQAAQQAGFRRAQSLDVSEQVLSRASIDTARLHRASSDVNRSKSEATHHTHGSGSSGPASPLPSNGFPPLSSGGLRMSVDALRRQASMRRTNSSLSRFQTVLTTQTSSGGVKREPSFTKPPSVPAADNLSPRDGAMSPFDTEEPELSIAQGSVPFHPNSNFRMGWDAIMFVCTAFALVTDPIGLAFSKDTPTSFLTIADRIVTAIFMIDIILNFLTGYVNKKDQQVIMHWRAVAFQYAKFWLLIDILSSLPPEAFEALSGDFSENSMFKGARISKILRCFKISRLARLVQVLQLNLDIRLSHFTWKIVTWVASCFLYLHWTTCAECWVWIYSDSPYRTLDLPGVEDKLGGDEGCLTDSACSSRYYLRGLRTAIAFMCGHGQETGQTLPEDLLAVICSLLGNMLYSSFIAVLISMLMEMDAERVRYMGQVERLNHYMGRRKVPLELRQRVREYMELTWMKNGGADDKEVLSFLSRSLRREITMHNVEKLVRAVPFLSVGTNGFVYSVVQALRPESFMAGDDIMVTGEIGQEMFLLERGIIDIIDDDGTTVIDSLGPGAWFGEIALQQRTLRTATIRAHTDGSLFVLERDDFLKLVPMFPQVAEELKKCNAEILRRIKRRKSLVTDGNGKEGLVPTSSLAGNDGPHRISSEGSVPEGGIQLSQAPNSRQTPLRLPSPGSMSPGLMLNIKREHSSSSPNFSFTPEDEGVPGLRPSPSLNSTTRLSQTVDRRRLSDVHEEIGEAAFAGFSGNLIQKSFHNPKPSVHNPKP